MHFAPITLIVLSTLALVMAVDLIIKQDRELAEDMRRHVTAFVNHDTTAKSTRNPILNIEHTQSAHLAYESASDVAKKQTELPPLPDLDAADPKSLSDQANLFASHTQKSREHEESARGWKDMAKNREDPKEKVPYIESAIQHGASAQAHADRASAHLKQLCMVTRIHGPTIRPHCDPKNPDSDYHAASLAHAEDRKLHEQNFHKSMGIIGKSSDHDAMVKHVMDAATSHTFALNHGAWEGHLRAKSEAKPRSGGHWQALKGKFRSVGGYKKLPDDK